MAEDWAGLPTITGDTRDWADRTAHDVYWNGHKGIAIEDRFAAALRKAREDALEEAAEYLNSWGRYDFAEHIRALKEQK